MALIEYASIRAHEAWHGATGSSSGTVGETSVGAGGDTADPGSIDPKDYNRLAQVFSDKYGTKPGAYEVMKDLHMGGTRAKGASWQVRYAMKYINADDVVGFERVVESGRRVDIVLQRGMRITFLDTKAINWYALEKSGEEIMGRKAADIVAQVLGSAGEDGVFSKVIIESMGSAPQWFLDVLAEAGIAVEVFAAL